MMIVMAVAVVEVNVKIRTLATSTSQTRVQKLFTILEVAADWNEPMIPQDVVRSSIARVNRQLEARC